MNEQVTLGEASQEQSNPEKRRESKFLTVAEAAEELGTTERALWQRIYRNQVPHRRWGKRVLIPKGELELFVNALPGLTATEAVAKAEAAVR